MSRNLGLSRDAKTIFAVRSIRGFASGFGALLLGTNFSHYGYGFLEVGVVLGVFVAGNVIMSLAVSKWSDRLGLRRSYILLFLVLAMSGFALAFTDSLLVFVIVALTGTLSTDLTDNGPFTSLEQSMLGRDLSGSHRISAFGIFNVIAALSASLGALATSLPIVSHSGGTAPIAGQRFFLVLVPLALASAIVATSLSPKIESILNAAGPRRRTGLERSKATVLRLSALFAADAFGGGFIVQSFITYWFEVKFHVGIGTLGVAFFAIGVLQSASFVVATFFAKRIGLLRTMVFSHLPSNVLLMFIPFAPTLQIALALLFVVSLLSKMDVPTRQAYVMELVDPSERTAAASYTNAARSIFRPAGPILAGVTQGIFPGLPFVIAGAIKGAYDLTLWNWFRNVELPEESANSALSENADADDKLAIQKGFGKEKQ